MEPAYDVFISHAGEDKEALAVPIYEALKRRGISSFLDREELRTGGKAAGAMLQAVDVSAIGVCILSPEYGAKHWPMLELERFLRNIERARSESGDGCKGAGRGPVLIPIFYRLGVGDCKDRQLFSKYTGLLHRKDLLARLGSGETSLKDILDNLEEVSRRTGIENKVGATNEATEYMNMKRERLVETICEEISRTLSGLQSKREHSSGGDANESKEDDMFQAEFYVPGNAAEVRLDFSSALTGDVSQTPEAEVMRKVLCRDKKPGQSRVVVIKGIGGVGKSCTLRGLGREKEVQRRYSGGVYFISLGMDATVNTLIGELLKVIRLSGGRKLAQKLLQEKDLDVILASVGRWIKGKRILLLVDDLWDRKSLGASIISRLLGILEGETCSMVVVTTRFGSIGAMGQTVEIKPREPTSGEARMIFLEYARLSEVEVTGWNLEERVAELLRIGGGLPVCLATMGRGIEELMQHCEGDKGLALRRYVGVISRKREDLVEMGVDDYVDLRTTLSASLEVLEESRKLGAQSYCRWSYAEMHRSLCVLQKPAVAPISVVCRLWGVEKEEEGWMIVKRFADVGLASIEVSSKDEMDCIRLHDLIHDYAVVCADIEKEDCVWHRRLLEGYLSIGDVDGVEKKVREWWRVGDDYMLRKLSWHLVCGERVNELVSLLFRCEWTELRSKRSGVVALEEDFSECMKALEGSKEFGEEKEVMREGLRAVRDALLASWGYIHGNWNEIGLHIFGRLGEEEGWGVREYLKSIEDHLEGPWLKPMMSLNQKWAASSEKGLDAEFVLDGPVECIVPVSRPVYAAKAGGEVVVVDIDKKMIMSRFGEHARSVLAFGVGGESKRVVCCCEDGTVIGWDVESGEEMERVVLERWKEESSSSDQELSCRVEYAAFDLNVTIVVGHCWDDKKVRMWDVNTGELLGGVKLKWSTARQHENYVECIGVSKHGKYIACGTNCGVQVWDVSMKTHFTEVMHGGEEYVWCIAFHPNEEMVAWAGHKEGIRIWDVRSDTAVEIFDHSVQGSFRSIAFDGDGQRIAAGSFEGISIWDVETRSVICRYSLRSQVWVCSIHFRVNTDELVFGSSDSMLRVWNMNESLDFADEHPERAKEEIVCIGISPDGSFYVSGCSDGTVMIWDANEHKPRGNVMKHEAGVRCIAVSSDNRLIGTGADDGEIRIWDANACEQKGKSLRGHSERVKSIAFSPDCQYLVSCSGEDGVCPSGDVRIWSIADSKQMGKVVSSAYDPWSSMLVSGIVEVGRAIGRKCGLLQAWTRIAGFRPTSAAITPDGKTVISSWERWEAGHEWEAGRLLDVTHFFNDERLWMSEVESGNFVDKLTLSSFDIKRITCPENNTVTIYPNWGPPSYWYLDEEKGMVKIEEDDIQEKIPYCEGEEHYGHCNEIACTNGNRFLVWRADGRRLGTLPVRPYEDAWLYDASREVIVIGGEDGHVYFYKVMK